MIPVTLMPSASSRRLSRLYRHLALWVLQSWLAMFYIAAGYAKLTQPQEMLAVLMTWPADASLHTIHMIGWAELIFAIGMVIPLISWSLFHRLMQVACIGLMAEATLMAVYHASGQYLGLALVNVALAVMSMTVIWGRGWRAPRFLTDPESPVVAPPGRLTEGGRLPALKCNPGPFAGLARYPGR